MASSHTGPYTSITAAQPPLIIISANEEGEGWYGDRYFTPQAFEFLVCCALHEYAPKDTVNVLRNLFPDLIYLEIPMARNILKQVQRDRSEPFMTLASMEEKQVAGYLRTMEANNKVKMPRIWDPSINAYRRRTWDDFV